MLRSVLIALTLLLLIPSQSSARELTEQDSLRIAEQAWPNNPCAGQITISYVEMGELLLGQVQTGFAPDGSYFPTSCEVLLSPRVRNDAVLMCETIVHEVGHLAGHRHEEGGVMGAIMDGGDWPPCQRSPRGELIDAIRDTLPLPRATWRISCGPTAPKMVCLTSRDGSRTRVYRTGIRNGIWTGFEFMRYRGIARNRGTP